ncbi:MAG: peptidoglycan DD-metalloendopeptidase family protein [Conexibacter sp.]|nr:peptidoglycan DD-metalloendopeptidase family protein [Conexibacter sp.]
MPDRMRLRHVLAAAALPLVLCSSLWLFLPLGSQASPQGRAASLQNKIETTRGKIGRRKGTEHVLTSEIQRWSTRITKLQGSISTLQAREQRIQSDLDARRAELVTTQKRLRSERARLARLRARLAEGRRILARRLAELYQADKPDLVTVVLNSKGFADLLERGEFLSRIQDQDNNVIRIVKSAKADATATAARLDTLERRQQQLTKIVLQRRDEVAQVKQQLIDTRVGYQNTRAGKKAALGKVRTERKSLENHLDELQKESDRVQAQLQGGGGLPPGPIKGGSGRFIWPVNGQLTSPFCESRAWESCHPGIDIAVPTGTPIRAADGGRVAIAGWVGGYGNYTCIQHTASLSTCYGHQSVLKVSVGASVTKGQVIGLSGSTGHSTGPHLHFEVRVNGAVQNPMGYL